MSFPFFIHLLLVCAVCMLCLRAVSSHLLAAIRYRVEQSSLSNSISNKMKKQENHERESCPLLLIWISLPDSSGLSIKWEAEDSAPRHSCWSTDPGYRVLSIRRMGPVNCPEWVLAGSCRLPDTLLNNTLNGTGPLSLTTVAVPGAFQQHSGNYPKFISDTKFRIKGTSRNDRVWEKVCIFFKSKKSLKTHTVVYISAWKKVASSVFFQYTSGSCWIIHVVGIREACVLHLVYSDLLG